MMRFRTLIPLWAVCAMIAAPTAKAAVIYTHVFDGNGDPLNGTAPDVDNNGGVNTWSAGTIFNDDGSFASSTHGAAILPFVPVDGKVYILEANILPFDTADTTGWTAIGFLDENNGGSPNGNGSRHSNSGGWAWQTVRNSSSAGDQVAFNGREAAAAGILYNADLVDATVAVATKTILDTTGGAGNWTAEYFLNGVSQAGPATLLAGSSNIQFVGFSHTSGGTDGHLNSFQLSVVPEPGAIMLISLGAISLLFARRRKRSPK